MQTPANMTLAGLDQTSIESLMQTIAMDPSRRSRDFYRPAFIETHSYFLCCACSLLGGYLCINTSVYTPLCSRITVLR